MTRCMLVAAVLSVFLAACTRRDDVRATQVVARVNSEEITVHQLNFLLENPDAAAADAPASVALATSGTARGAALDRQAALDHLIDEELLVQAAKAQDLDRNPDVLAATESARRGVLARALLDRVEEEAAAPGANDIREYFSAHPALFAERRIYTLREIRIPDDEGTTSAGADALRARLSALWQRSHDWDALLASVRASVPNHVAATRVLAAEALPLDEVPILQGMGEGEARFVRSQNALRIQQVARIVHAPMDLPTATPMISAYLRAQRGQQAAQAAIARLRQSARIERIGEFARAADASTGAALRP